MWSLFLDKNKMEESFRDEAVGHTLYKIYGDRARSEGLEDIARLYYDTSENELSHAKAFYDELNGKEAIEKLIPTTLEGCVVRISDIIAYIGKDRQDAARMGICTEECFTPTAIGRHNAEFIHNMTVNIIENSSGKPYIRMDQKHFDALKIAKKEIAAATTMPATNA